MNKFINLNAKQIFPDLPDARKDGGVASSKQIGYVYVLAKQKDIPKEDLEEVSFRHFSTEEISKFIDCIKNNRFYEEYMNLYPLKEEQPTLFKKIEQIDDSELPFF